MLFKNIKKFGDILAIFTNILFKKKYYQKLTNILFFKKYICIFLLTLFPKKCFVNLAEPRLDLFKKNNFYKNTL
jgi:hypothetical protein